MARMGKARVPVVDDAPQIADDVFAVLAAGGHETVVAEPGASPTRGESG